MLRQTKARLLAGLATLLVGGLAALFSVLNNPLAPQATPPKDLPPQTTPVPPAPAGPQVEAGRLAFERLGCGNCHSIEGQGSPRSPLDGVGSRMDAATLRAWVIAGESVRGSMSAPLARFKARYADDPELDALVAYLQSLK
jgi:mono/diheme cytochrome c family protein